MPMSRPSLSRRLATAAATGCLMFAGTVAGPAAVSQAGTHRSSAPGLGHWTELGLSQSAPPELWLGPDHRGWVVWAAATTHQYRLAMVSATGKVGKPSTITKGWSGVIAQPTLVSNGKSPLLIFSGQKGSSGGLSAGCAVGATPASPQWHVQSWSLSNNCVFSNVGFGDAAENKSGQLAAGWFGGPGVEYRIGISPTIPATGKDSGITLTLSHGDAVAMANNTAGNGHYYLAFYRFFSKNAAKDGVYVKDLTANGAPLKAPLTGTVMSTYQIRPQRVPMASPNAHGGGVYLAYCKNKANCPTYLLWKAGAKKAITVPHTKLALGLAMSDGPDGRLWLAWYNEQQNRVIVMRTNKADNRFGPTRSVPVPCDQDGNTHLALTSGNSGRLDVGLECLSAKQTKPTVFVTQSEASLSISAKPGKITNTHSNKVTFTVNDAGDPVAGAKVKIAGKTLTTSKKGTVSFTFAKGAKPGTYTATASATDYFSGTTTVKVSS
jgi:hypothetical protein